MNFGNLGRQTFAAPFAALTLVAGGGIALAATGGDPAPQAVEHRSVAEPSANGKPSEHTEDRSDDDDSDASPSPSLTGLCHAYQAGGYAASTKNGHVNPAWSALESAAGGEDDVDEFCEDRLDSDDADKPDKGPKSANARDGDSDDDSDSDDRGNGGPHGSEHGRP